MVVGHFFLRERNAKEKKYAKISHFSNLKQKREREKKSVNRRMRQRSEDPRGRKGHHCTVSESAVPCLPFKNSIRLI